VLTNQFPARKGYLEVEGFVPSHPDRESNKRKVVQSINLEIFDCLRAGMLDVLFSHFQLFALAKEFLRLCMASLHKTMCLLPRSDLNGTFGLRAQYPTVLHLTGFFKPKKFEGRIFRGFFVKSVRFWIRWVLHILGEVLGANPPARGRRRLYYVGVRGTHNSCVEGNTLHTRKHARRRRGATKKLTTNNK